MSNFLAGFLDGFAPAYLEGVKKQEKDKQNQTLGTALLNILKASQPYTTDATPQGSNVIANANKAVMSGMPQLNNGQELTSDMIGQGLLGQPTRSTGQFSTGMEQYTPSNNPVKTVIPTLNNLLSATQGVKGDQLLKLFPYIMELNQMQMRDYEAQRRGSAAGLPAKKAPFYSWFEPQ
jgi:hypothetical protein